MGSMFWTPSPHRRYDPIHIVLLGVHQLRHYLPLVASRIVFVCVHRCLLLCSLLSWTLPLSASFSWHEVRWSRGKPLLHMSQEHTHVFSFKIIFSLGLTTVSRPHCLILVKVVVLKLVKVLLRHCGLCFWPKNIVMRKVQRLPGKQPLGRIKRARRASYRNRRFPKLWLGPWQELDSAQWMDLAWLGSSGSAAAQCCGLELQLRSNNGVGPDRVYCAGGPILQLAARDEKFLQWNYSQKMSLSET